MTPADQAQIAQGDFLSQDFPLAETRQRGLRSMAFEDANFSEQEAMVRRSHEVLDDYLEGRRPGTGFRNPIRP